MKTSEKIGQLSEALAKARKEFRPVLKKSTNPFFKSKYAELSEVIEATSEALANHGLSVIQMPGHVGLVDGSTRINLTSLLTHSSGEWIESEMSLPVSKNDAQGVGSATTYARRYAYQSIVGVSAEPDDDGNEASQKFEKQPDGSFAKTTPPAKSTENVQPKTVIGVNTGDKPKTANELLGKETKKPVGRPKKADASDFQPWGGLITQTITTPAVEGQTVTISDADLPDNLQGSRLPTDEEAKSFRERLIKVKDKGYSNIGPWILKKTGKKRSQDIPYSDIARIVDEVEKAEAEGTLKEMLAQ